MLSHATHTRPLLTLALCITLGACGGDDDGSSTPSAIDGPFLMTFGSQPRLFSLKPGEAQVTCRPKPGLGEFEMNATTLGSDGASSFQFILKEYADTQTSYDIEYEVGKPVHVVDLKLSGGYQYKFFQSFRTDINQTFNSRCSVELASEDKGNVTEYTGNLYCVMIWADTGSKDFSTSILNNYVDLAAKFSCEY